MNTLKKSIVALSILFAFVFTASLAHADDAEDAATVKQARAAVEAAPENARTLAKSAQACIEKGLNLEEAGRWIKKAARLQPNDAHAKILGDYYKAVGMKREAVNAYAESVAHDTRSGDRKGIQATQKAIQKYVKEK